MAEPVSLIPSNIPASVLERGAVSDSVRLIADLFQGWEFDCHGYIGAGDSVCAGYGTERVAILRGVVYNTIINENKINVRNGPSYDSDILFSVDILTKVQILGVSEESTLVDNRHWVKVRIKASDGVWMDGEYWIFSRFVVYSSNERILPLKMQVREDGHGGIIVYYEVENEEKIISLRNPAVRHEDFYTFFYCLHSEGSHYRLVPGAYAWYPESGELRHLSYFYVRNPQS
jgi:hypothetical protein